MTVFSGAATFSGAGGLKVNAFKTKFANAVLSGAGFLAANAVTFHPIVASDLTSPSPILDADPAFTAGLNTTILLGAGRLVASAQVFEQVAASDLTGPSPVMDNTPAFTAGTVPMVFSGAGGMVADAIQYVGFAIDDGFVIATFSAPSVGENMVAAARLSAVGSAAVASASENMAAAARLSAAGAALASATIPAGGTAWSGASVLAGAGAFAAVAQSQLSANVLSAGASALTAKAILRLSASLSMSGVASFVAAAGLPASGVLIGVGSLAAVAQLRLSTSGLAAGTGALAVNAINVGFANALLSGAAALVASAATWWSAIGLIAGAGALKANALKAKFANALLSGSAAMVSSATIKWNINFSGTGAVKVAARMVIRPRVVLAVSSEILVDAGVLAIGSPPVHISDTDDAITEVRLVLDRLLASAQGQTGTSGAQLRWQCGRLSTNVGSELKAGGPQFWSDFTGCFEAARLAGATFWTMDVVRRAAEDLNPDGLLAITAKNFAVRMALAEMALILKDINFKSRQDVDRYFDVIDAAFNLAEEVAANALDNVGYVALVGLHAAVSNDLANRSRPLPRMVTYQFATRMPSLWIAQRVYHDGGRHDELIAENKPIHPLFCQPVGKALSA